MLRAITDVLHLIALLFITGTTDTRPSADERLDRHSRSRSESRRSEGERLPFDTRSGRMERLLTL